MAGKTVGMKFSEWSYTRPDYPEVRNKINSYKSKMQNASSYQMFRDAWLNVKKEMEYMEFQEEIVYIRHLCVIDYEYSLKEVEIQNKEDSELYALCDECNVIAAMSEYRHELEQEFGNRIFKNTNTHLNTADNNSMRLRSKELELKLQYRKLMAVANKDEEALYQVFRELINIRRELADSLGYNSYIDMGYHIHKRYDYGTKELTEFRRHIRECVAPAIADIKSKKIGLSYFPAAVDSNELISAIATMYKDLSYEAGIYMDEVIQKELYDLEIRANKRSNIFSCCMLPYKKLPFIVGNYTGDGMETGYAVHEFGHGFAFYTAARKQPLYELHRSSPSVNEIHSKTMEHFMYPYLNIFVGEHKKEYIRNHLIQQLENLVYRSAIDEFEHSIYGKESMSKVQICRLWADISNRYMPWNRISTEEIQRGYCWPRQTHIVESPFYYIEYDIAQISTYELYLRMKNSKEQAWADYMELCSAGGSKSYLELLDIAHLSNPFSEDTVEDICSPIIDELYSLL